MAPRQTSSSASPRFVRIDVSVADRDAADRVAAEAYAAGALGLEERDDDSGSITLLLYAPLARATPVRRAALATPDARARAREPLALPEIDWSERWKAGLEPVEISPRLRVRPSFAPARAAAGQADLCIDPGQAFGTGGHASTRLALEWIDAVAPDLEPGARVLDVGTGTGVLALAALRLGAARAVALDVDLLAARAARDNARANGLGDRVDVFAGELDALAGGGFDLVVANLLRRELLPLAGRIAERTGEGGVLVVSGLLVGECGQVEAALAEHGLAVRGERRHSDAAGDAWAALLMGR